MPLGPEVALTGISNGRNQEQQLEKTWLLGSASDDPTSGRTARQIC